VRGLSTRRAADVLRSDIEAFERLGYRPQKGDSPYSELDFARAAATPQRRGWRPS
jgi:hypothetical protein